MLASKLAVLVLLAVSVPRQKLGRREHPPLGTRPSCSAPPPSLAPSPRQATRCGRAAVQQEQAGTCASSNGGGAAAPSKAQWSGEYFPGIVIVKVRL